MLAILRTEFVRNGSGIGRIVEYTGDAVADLNIDERATMTNRAAEVERSRAYRGRPQDYRVSGPARHPRARRRDDV